MSALTFFREQKLISILLAFSVLTILLGVALIWYNQKAAVKSQQDHAQYSAVETIATLAARQLQNTVSDAPEEPIQDIKPSESLQKVAELNGQTPEVGTEGWCEWMMVKDAAAWTPDEQAEFAKHCI